jgi:ubiquinol-cytochrome c reductase cytochrome c1 subunit
MRALRSLLAPAVVLGAVLSAFALAPARAADETPHPPHQHWHSDGIFGTTDLAAAQRGFLVYKSVCANCHGMRLMSYRNLTGLGLSEEEVKAIAASITVPLGLNDAGEPFEGPATPASRFRAPYPNDKVARVVNNGALPPDLSVIVRAREGGADYIYALLTGFGDPPADMRMGAGMNYNKYFPGHQIAMRAPLVDDQVEYADGTKATVPQMARDVTEFLTWAGAPEITERKRMGIRVVLFLGLMTVLTYLVKRQVWSSLH